VRTWASRYSALPCLVSSRHGCFYSIGLSQADVPPELRQALEVVPCQRLEDILAAAFDPPLVLKQTPLLARL
jgi:hypothetical protein